MKPFTDAEMQALYGSREEYERRVRDVFDRMVRERTLLPGDAELMMG